MEKYDAAIIGGGPAGSTAALYLNDLGFNVCLIEKKNFPRETLCGEFLSKEVIDSLKNLNLFDGFLKLNPNPITNFKFYNDSNDPIETKLKFPAYGIK
ncbi:MAG: FAD-dependent oxidoreductase, partial [Bacteroidota bacterium]